MALQGAAGAAARPADLRAEQGAVVAALVVGAVQVRDEVRLAQPFAGAGREGGDTARTDAEEDADAGSGFVLDDGVPQDGLPALGQ
ncbi:hypothetical protein [Streptomyces longispororuber]|uniref:hypothetical protein n=1 Tax=Streptomyces longispororuber TaxID=68230 RepID=UPI00210C04D9|nr:hypothetical protein [Streptomyces longispororuber]MCQ4214155.1 hypothetical protein [Streptomyces longispororuber]